MKTRMTAAAIAAFAAGASAWATPFTGSFLVQSQAPGAIAFEIREYSSSGVLIQTIIPPAPPGSTDLQHPRDLIVGQDGNISLFNGTFDPYLSTYNPAAIVWSHVTRDDWGTVNNVSYGGIARWGNRAFVTDMLFGSPAGGVIAFDVNTGESSEFATNLAPTDLNLGLDGNLWVLDNGRAWSFDPATLLPLGSVLLGGNFDVRGIAVAANGEFFLATWDGQLARLAPNGSLLNTIALGDSLIDVDLAPGGELLVGSRLNNTWLTNTSFASPQVIQSGRWNSFVTFIPEPATLAMLLLILPSLRRRN
jgi:hypothetical protein